MRKISELLLLSIIILGVSILATCQPALAQSSYLDSLSLAIESAPADTTRVRLLNDIVIALRDKDPNRALEHATVQLELSEKIKDKRGTGHALQHIGWIHYRKGNYVVALDYSLRALAINKEVGDQSLVAHCSNNIGAIQYEQKLYSSAISYFKQGYELGRQLNDNAVMSRSLNNISFCYLAVKKLDSAEYYVKIAIEEGDKADNRYKTGFSDRILGDILFEKGQYEEALDTFLKCLDMARQRGHNSLIASVLHRIGRTYIKLNQPDKALTYLLENAEKTRKLGYKDELEKTYSLLIEAYKMKKDINKAFEFQSLYIHIHDSIFNESNAKELAHLQSRYENEIKEARISLQDQKIRSQRIAIYSSLAGVILLFIIASVLFYYNRRVTKTNFELAERNAEVRTRTEQLAELNATKDRLLSIIGHDLRSPINGLRGLVDLASGGNLTMEEFRDISVQAKRNLDYLSEDLDNLLNWAHSQLGNLNPIPEYLPVSSIVAHKAKLFEPISREKRVSIVPEVDPTIEIFMDRNHFDLVLRNLLSNALKFSNPGNIIHVTGRRDSDNNILVSVSDQGVGMNEKEVDIIVGGRETFTKPGTQKEKGMGLGLTLVREFVDKNFGKLLLESAPGKGSTFTLMLPGRQMR